MSVIGICVSVIEVCQFDAERVFVQSNLDDVLMSFPEDRSSLCGKFVCLV